jgi:hypothetical protein
MVRRKRMGVLSALDELLPGPPEASRQAAERPRHGVRPKRARPKRMGPYNALDDLLPGPATAGLDWAPQPEASWPEWLRPSRAGHDGTERFDPLDELMPGPPAAEAPAKVRASFQLPRDVLEAVRDAAAHLSAPPLRMTMTALAERALRVEVERLAEEHNLGRPFPPRPPSARRRR